MYILFAQTLFKQNQFCYKTKKIYIGGPKLIDSFFSFEFLQTKLRDLSKK